MSELNIVSGPFSVDTEDGVCIIRAPDGGGIAQMKFLKGSGGLKGRRDADQVINTARVMAASEDMYRALNDIMTAIHECEQDDEKSIVDYITEDMEAAADQALAKARGEQ